MNEEQFKELCEHVTDKLTNGEIVSSFIGLLYGLCNENAEEVKAAINHFEEEAKKSRG